MATTLYHANQYFTTTLSVTGGIDASQTTGIVLASASGLDTTKPSVALLEWADPIGSNREWITYTSVNSTTKELQGVVRGAEGDGGTGKIHANGVAVAFPISESHINNLATALSIGGVATNGVTKTINTSAQSVDPSTEIVTKSYVDGLAQPQSLYDNLLINGNMDISQRATTFVAGANNDDVYTLDQWTLLSDGNDVFDVSQEAVTDLAGSSYAIKLDVETAKRGGIIQFIEAKDAIKFRGQTVSLSFKVKSANISALRAGILSWDGTADTLTSDVVGTWGATPTPVANWTFENTPADLTVTSDWTTVKVEGIVLDTSGMNNLGVFIWTPNEETIGDIVYISQVKVNQGATATSFMPRSILEEKLLCYRYFFYSGVGTLGTGDGNEQTYAFKYSTSVSNLVFGTVSFPAEMRKAPVVRCYASTSGTGAGTIDRVRSLATGSLVDVSSASIRTSVHGIVEIFKSSAFTSGVHHAFNFSAEAEL